MGSFLTDCRTTLAINQKAIDFFAVSAGIPQGSLISPILYLYYNADLLEICERPGTTTSALSFIDDVNILAYGTSTEENLKTLERVHTQCEAWACRHGSTFTPKKYELTHLAQNSGRFDMAATITIGGETKTPKADIRMLGIQIDTKLRWKPHVKKIQEKSVTQTRALTKITTSTWGAIFARARHVYCAVVHPAITYGSAIRNSPARIKCARKDMVDKSVVI